MFTSVSVFLFALSLRTVKSDEPVYRAVGDKVVLKPGPVQGPITGITWKHGKDIAIEWYQGTIEGYRQFKERGSLNVTTGALTITGLTPGESGSYTAEINNKVTSTTQLLVISRVSKPTVSTQCDADHCVFTCENNDTTAEPVTYSWMAEEKLLNSSNELRITKDESEKQFHCELRNPVSTEMSESVHNLFRTWKLNNRVHIICPVLLIGGLIFFIGFIFLILYKRKKTKEPPEGSNHGPATNSPSETSHKDVVSEVEGSMNHVPTPTAPLEKSEEREPLMGSSRDPESYVPSETSRKNETILEIPLVQVHTNQTESEDTDNKTEVPAGSNQDPTSDAAPGSSSETERRLQQISGANADNPAPGSESPEGSNNGPATNGPLETRPENEGSEVEGSMNHVPTPTAPLDNSEERESLMGSSRDPESDVPSETSRKDEVPGASNKDPTSDAAPESSTDTGKLSDCLKDQGISTHNQETSALTESTNRTGESTVIPSVQDSPVQEQAADGQNQT